MGVKYTNNAETTLASAISSTSATSVTVASSSTFPSLSGSDYFYATLELADASAREVVKVTAVSGTTWTVVRAQDDTTARTFSVDDKVELRLANDNNIIIIKSILPIYSLSSHICLYKIR